MGPQPAKPFANFGGQATLRHRIVVAVGRLCALWQTNRGDERSGNEQRSRLQAERCSGSDHEEPRAHGQADEGIRRDLCRIESPVRALEQRFIDNRGQERLGRHVEEDFTDGEKEHDDEQQPDGDQVEHDA